MCICDFGISRIKDFIKTMHTMKAGGPGTYPYMALEMFQPAHRGTAVDMYSLGCLYIELFGGERVWGKVTGIQIMQKVCGSYNCPPEMPRVTHLCTACCELDPDNRPSAQDVEIVKL